MSTFCFDPDKNALLAAERGVSFEDIIVAIESGNLLDVLHHPNQNKYSGQKLYIVSISHYAYVVPVIENGEVIFLKTAFPSRKMTKKYLKEVCNEDA